MYPFRYAEVDEGAHQGVGSVSEEDSEDEKGHVAPYSPGNDQNNETYFHGLSLRNIMHLLFID